MTGEQHDAGLRAVADVIDAFRCPACGWLLWEHAQRPEHCHYLDGLTR